MQTDVEAHAAPFLPANQIIPLPFFFFPFFKSTGSLLTFPHLIWGLSCRWETLLLILFCFLKLLCMSFPMQQLRTATNASQNISFYDTALATRSIIQENIHLDLVTAVSTTLRVCMRRERDLHLEVLPVLLNELTCRRCRSDRVKNLQPGNFITRVISSLHQ